MKNKEELLRSGERLDDLQLSGLSIIQDPSRFCFGMDAVLLSGFVTARPGDKILDLGTGNGILALLLSAKTEAALITGLELQPEVAELARRSVSYNKLEEKIEIVIGDLREASKRFGAASFEVVVSNPPYMPVGSGLQNPDDAKAIARHEVCCTLIDILRETAKILTVGGRCFFCYRPFRLAELLSGMNEFDLAPKRMRLVYPYIDAEPNLVLVEGRHGGNSGMTVEKPLIIYRGPGVYTDELVTKFGY